ncbi:MAG: hypothetical protein R2815_11425 [Flavobacteriales bacterium]
MSSVAEGNELAILSSGFTGAAAEHADARAGTPKGLRAVLTAHPGKVSLDWDPTRGAVTYHVQVNRVSPDDANAWELVGVTTRSRYSVSGLDAGEAQLVPRVGHSARQVPAWEPSGAVDGALRTTQLPRSSASDGSGPGEPGPLCVGGGYSVILAGPL